MGDQTVNAVAPNSKPLTKPVVKPNGQAPEAPQYTNETYEDSYTNGVCKLPPEALAPATGEAAAVYNPSQVSPDQAQNADPAPKPEEKGWFGRAYDFVLGTGRDIGHGVVVIAKSAYEGAKKIFKATDDLKYAADDAEAALEKAQSATGPDKKALIAEAQKKLIVLYDERTKAIEKLNRISQDPSVSPDQRAEAARLSADLMAARTPKDIQAVLNNIDQARRDNRITDDQYAQLIVVASYQDQILIVGLEIKALDTNDPFAFAEVLRQLMDQAKLLEQLTQMQTVVSKTNVDPAIKTEVDESVARASVESGVASAIVMNEHPELLTPEQRDTLKKMVEDALSAAGGLISIAGAKADGAAPQDDRLSTSVRLIDYSVQSLIFISELIDTSRVNNVVRETLDLAKKELKKIEEKAEVRRKADKQKDITTKQKQLRTEIYLLRIKIKALELSTGYEKMEDVLGQMISKSNFYASLPKGPGSASVV